MGDGAVDVAERVVGVEAMAQSCRSASGGAKVIGDIPEALAQEGCQRMSEGQGGGSKVCKTAWHRNLWLISHMTILELYPKPTQCLTPLPSPTTTLGNLFSH